MSWRDEYQAKRMTARDASTMLAALAEGKCSFDEFRAAWLDSGDGYRGNLFTPDALTRLLRDAGFVNIAIADPPAAGNPSPEFQICAERPSG